MSAMMQEPAEQIDTYATKLINLSAEHGFSVWLGYGEIIQGWAYVQKGQVERGIQQILSGLDQWERIEAGLDKSFFFALLSQSYMLKGDIIAAFRSLNDAFVETTRSQDRYYEAELCRLKGELTLQLGARDQGLGTGSSSTQASSLMPQAPRTAEQEAEGYFLKAIDIARQQQAKSWELRASTSLARLWQAQGKNAEAHKLLSEIYNWFTEGFNTKDLQEAKKLLAELSA